MRSVAHEGPLEDLAGEWQDLFERDCRATPFSAPGWILPWWRDYGRACEPLTVKVLEDGRLAGLAALAVRRHGPFRVLFGAGTGVGNYWDVLAAEPEREEVTRLVAAHVAEASSRWDALVLDRGTEDSPLPGALALAGLRVLRRPPIAAPCLALPDTFDDYVRTLSRNMKRYARRAVRQVDSGEFELREAAAPGQLADAIAHWHELRLRWWRERARDLNPDHARPGFARFCTEAMQGLVPHGRAQVLELWSEGARVGVTMNLLDAGTFYWWLSGFDPAVADRSPGHAAITATIRASIAAGRRRYDFMVGEEDYKYRYGGVNRWLPYLVVGSGRPRSRLVLGAVRQRDRRRRSRENP